MRVSIGFLVFCVASLVIARENPFSIALDPSNVGRTTQIKEERVDFNGTQFTFPSTARILKSVSIVFQNLDGSISEEIVAVDQTIDWHYPLAIAPKKPDVPKTPETLPQSLAKVPEAKKSESMPTIIMPEIKPEVHPKVESMMLGEGVGVEVVGKSLMIYTKDVKVRDFLITKPFKVVVDFQSAKEAFATKSVDFTQPPFVSATLGNHEGFYRVAIVLDGHYRYDIARVDGGYSITLK